MSKPMMNNPSGPKGKAGAVNPGMNGGLTGQANVTIPPGRAGQPGGMTEINIPMNGKMATHKHVKTAPGHKCQ